MVKRWNGYQLKWIALLTMTLDHAGKMFAIFWSASLAAALHIDEQLSSYIIAGVISPGHLTIYIFMWFIAEGCRYTHDLGAYIRRLVLFGLISEIPFQFMIAIIMEEPLTVHWGLTNIMFTFALGASACYGYARLKQRGYSGWALLSPVLCAALAYWMQTDYGAFGVIGIFILYGVRDSKRRLLVLAGLIVGFSGLYQPLADVLTYGFDKSFVPFYIIALAGALPALPLLAAYNGRRGKAGRAAKYLFYMYYPLHITILVLLYGWIG